MKKILLAIAVVLTAWGANAQLPTGAMAPDFTINALDAEGNPDVEYNLYDYLDMGYHVIIDVSATWCGPCWGYHTSGVLEDIYEAHGPDGDQTIMVFWIEGDPTTTIDEIYGSGGSTQGDWYTGTSFPMADAADVASLYEIAYYPTTFMICPNRYIIDSESIQPAESVIMNFFEQNICQQASEMNDPALLAYTGTKASCGDVLVKALLSNNGTTTLTSCTIEVTGGDSPVSFPWTGNLPTYSFQEVTIGLVPTSGNVTLDIEITSADNNMGNNMVSAAIQEVTLDATDHIIIDIMPDNWFYETAWMLTNEAGEVIASVDAYDASAAYQSDFYDLWVPMGCYTFTITDAYGDGLHASQWGAYEDGYCYVYSLNGANQYSSLVDYNGSDDFLEITNSAHASVAAGVSENQFVHVMNAFPNPTSDLTNINFSIANEGNVTVNVINLLGEEVMVNNLGKKVAGQYMHQLDMSSLSAGVYMVNINNNGSIATLRVNVSK